jgi:hypothetical protein
MRDSVMELGRFTLQGGSGGQPATKLIILHVGGERNEGLWIKLTGELLSPQRPQRNTEENPREPL